MTLGVVWTQWMAPAIVFLVIVGVIVTFVMYLVKVQKPKYPPRGATRG